LPDPAEAVGAGAGADAEDSPLEAKEPVEDCAVAGPWIRSGDVLALLVGSGEHDGLVR
jgi:hypothetical protein